MYLSGMPNLPPGTLTPVSPAGNPENARYLHEAYKQRNGMETMFDNFPELRGKTGL
jgi:hypothetical protein